MKTCPDCGDFMEREVLAGMQGGGLVQYDCPGCGAEWESTKGSKGLRRIAEGSLDVVSFFERGA